MTKNLDTLITDFGREIFTSLGEEKPGTLQKNFWIGKIMEWSMEQQDFKTNLFRLVDVLPTLQTSEAVSSHLQEYLGPVAGKLHPRLEGIIRHPTRSIRAKLATFAVRRGVKEIASLFIAGETPQTALKPLRKLRADGLAFTIDLLGEFSVSEREAITYLNRYIEALEVLSDKVPSWKESAPHIAGHPGEMSPVCISVKLTALYSQCNPLNFKRSVKVLKDRLGTIARLAKKKNVLLYVDAEDSANNPILYETFKQVFRERDLIDFPLPGMVLQAYSRSSEPILRDLIEYAKERGAPIAIRLVKGAYWDFETVLSKQMGLPSPLFAHKQSSDAHFEHLSRILIDNHRYCLPAIASHNIRSLSHACLYAQQKGLKNTDFEIQTLYGMAEPIALAFTKKGYLVRLYVPLGDMFVGMGYLVRRLLENTSNESFLRHTFFDAKEIDHLLRKPVMHPGDLPIEEHL